MGQKSIAFWSFFFPSFEMFSFIAVMQWLVHEWFKSCKKQKNAKLSLVPCYEKRIYPFSLFWDTFLGTPMGHIWMLDYWLDNTNNKNQLIMKVNISGSPTWYDVNDRKGSVVTLFVQWVVTKWPLDSLMIISPLLTLSNTHECKGGRKVLPILLFTHISLTVMNMYYSLSISNTQINIITYVRCGHQGKPVVIIGTHTH